MRCSFRELSDATCIAYYISRQHAIDYDITTVEGIEDLSDATLKFSKKIDTDLILIVKTKEPTLQDFILGAGKIIFAISIILWFLASYGGKDFKNAEEIVKSKTTSVELTKSELSQEIAKYQLENSYIGKLGKTIEPAIKPLGYDWKIGIALLSSFAAREVFVGTLATIYSVADDGENATTIKERMNSEINPITGGKRFTFATGMSLLLFYAFAMQCMGTLAVVKRETNSWKWPILQLVGMTLLAYIIALLAFQFLK